MVRDRFLVGIHDSNGVSLVNRQWPDTFMLAVFTSVLFSA